MGRMSFEAAKLCITRLLQKGDAAPAQEYSLVVFFPLGWVSILLFRALLSPFFCFSPFLVSCRWNSLSLSLLGIACQSLYWCPSIACSSLRVCSWTFTYPTYIFLSLWKQRTCLCCVCFFLGCLVWVSYTYSSLPHQSLLRGYTWSIATYKIFISPRLSFLLINIEKKSVFTIFYLLKAKKDWYIKGYMSPSMYPYVSAHIYWFQYVMLLREEKKKEMKRKIEAVLALKCVMLFLFFCSL